jgi:2,3-bisphosphoglycerate-independent phosphoglycerate mutase
MGLLSAGGVHSHQDHLQALLRLAKKAGLEQVYLHLWLDGRDVGPHSAPASLEFLAGAVNNAGIGRIASLCGRYYAMDRDGRWDRIERAYRAMVQGEGHLYRSAVEAVMASYHSALSDEFMEPSVMTDSQGRPVAAIARGDAVFLFNFRPDRVRQISRALADPDFSGFDRPFPAVDFVAGMTQYDENFPLPRVFPPSEGGP